MWVFYLIIMFSEKTKTVSVHEKTYVYVLTDLTHNDVYYVGITYDVASRLTSHQNRFISYRDVNMSIVAEFYDRGLAEEYEYLLINKLISRGVSLENKKIKQ